MQGSGEKAPKNHYASLDGLRGFAAISVVLYHIGHWLGAPGLATNSGLAVDLFFCLSGFVLPLAYERRAASLSVMGFMAIRLIRLMPLILLAIAISAIYVLLRDWLAGFVPYAALASAILLGVLNLPYFGAPQNIGGPEVFPLNGPQYTLFLELLVNLVWWAMRRRDQLTVALVAAVICFAVLPFTGLGGDLPETFWSGLPRVGASFFAGVALYHLAPRVTDRSGLGRLFWLFVAIMIALFYAPFPLPLGVELVWIAVLSPLLILTGSRVRLSEAQARIGTFLGALSYPIYCLHYPIFAWINGIYRHFYGAQNIAIEGPVTLVAVLVLSYVALRFYDEPLRHWIGKRRKRVEPASPMSLVEAKAPYENRPPLN